jgi:HEPN domain-containing protein
VQSWFAKAEGDLQAAEILLVAPGAHGDVVAFHCQQAAEKYMKAYLVRHQIEFSKTHDLPALRRLIRSANESLADTLAFADWLTPFGVEIRYPGLLPGVDAQTGQNALSDSKRVRHVILDALKEYLDRGRAGSETK